MSYVVARMQKMKADNLVGIGNHNQRRTKNHSNQDIDISKSHLNYDLVNRTDTYKTDIQQFINEKKASKRATRKDAVLVNEWIITSDKPFFDRLDEEQTRQFFESAKRYFAEEFGDDNIRYAQVHLDEKTPHMHLGIVPFDDENKLSAKRVFNRQALQAIQDDFPRFMNEQGFSLQRGEKDSQRKNLSVPEYKTMKEDLKILKTDKEQTQEEVNQLSTEVHDLEKDYQKYLAVMDTVQDIDVKSEPVMEKKGFFKREEIETDQAMVAKDDFKKLHEAYRYVPTLKKELSRSRGAELAQREEKSEIRAERDELKKENKKLNQFVDKAKKIIQTLDQFLEKHMGMRAKDIWNQKQEKTRELKKTKEQEQEGPSL